MDASVLGVQRHPSIRTVETTTNDDGDKFETKFAEQIQWSKLNNRQWRFAWKVAMSHQKETYQSVAQLNYHMSPDLFQLWRVRERIYDDIPQLLG